MGVPLLFERSHLRAHERSCERIAIAGFRPCLLPQTPSGEGGLCEDVAGTVEGEGHVLWRLAFFMWPTCWA